MIIKFLILYNTYTNYNYYNVYLSIGILLFLKQDNKFASTQILIAY